MTTPQAFFGEMLEKVAGQAFAAAGYSLQENPTHQARGLFRYRKDLGDGESAYVEFQLLYYQGGGRSRFRVNLLRGSGPDARARTASGPPIETTLGKLLWDEFGVQQLGSADHWWLFNTPNEMAHALAEAGKFALAFGIPWLEGTLDPSEDAEELQ